jgi:molecular chaperone DnaJ
VVGLAEKRDYYEVLGIGKGAAADDIKKAYRKKAREYHPDVNKNSDAEAKMKEINEAYEVLSDDDKKAHYDRFGHASPHGGGGYNGGYGNYSTGGFGGFDFDIGGFSDIFDLFGGGRASRANRSGPMKGEDISRFIDLTFEEAAKGVSKEVSVTHLEKCKTCGGSGAAKGTVAETCTVCGGTGQVNRQQTSLFGTFSASVTCQNCNGTGKVIKNPCRDCGGSGAVRTTKKITVKFPHGINDNETLRVAGEGDCGKRGGASGDLYLTVRLQSHFLFERRGYDVVYTLPITIFEASIGTEIEVATIDGKAKLTIPEGTQNGEIFRMRGKGIQHIRGSGRGDQYIKVEVEVPKSLNSKQKKAIKELKGEVSESSFARRKNFVEKLKKL